MSLKEQVRDFWDEKSCGEVYADGIDEAAALAAQAQTRYQLEPYIADFARFAEGRDQDVLEIGVGMGADHCEWAKAQPRSLTGIDLTPRAIDFTRKRLAYHGYYSNLQTSDAERLIFSDNSFDLVYSWGVLHHTPDTKAAISEVHRVLRPGGKARIMIYHKYSFVGDLLWLRYGLMRGQPGRTLKDIYAQHLESPGTQAFSLAEAHAMLTQFRSVNLRSQLSFGDLLEGAVGQQHQGALLTIAKRVWPRTLIKTLFPQHGLMLLIDAVK